jgi:hypothetical protein
MVSFIDKMLLDSILRIKKVDPEWKGRFIFVWTVLGAINLFTIGFWLNNYFQILSIPTLKVNLFPPNIYIVSMLNYVPGFCLLYGFPAFIITYFLIFHNGRYLKLMRRYPEMTGNKNYQFIYLFGTLAFGLVSFFTVCALKGLLC